VRALPGFGNNWGSVVALDDLLRQISLAVASTRQPFVFYGVTCLINLVMTILSNLLLMAPWRPSGGWRPSKQIGICSHDLARY
jgi:polar amino acid transport system permease protein